MLLDGRGGKAKALVENASAKAATLQVEEFSRMERPNSPVWLAQAMPLGKTMDTIVQKAAELGCECVVPLCTERSELRLDAERTLKKTQKWRTGALEAIKQCGNPFMPDIVEPCGLDALFNMALPPLRLVCSLEEASLPLLAALKDENAKGGVVLAIGPEGDFSTAEYAQFREHSFKPVTLGPLVLRADTAAIASMAIVSEALRFAACPLPYNV